MVTEAFS